VRIGVRKSHYFRQYGDSLLTLITALLFLAFFIAALGIINTLDRDRNRVDA